MMRRSSMVYRNGRLFWSPADTPEKVAANFFSKVVVVECGCWEWQGGVNDKGYGLFNGDGERYAHRWSYKSFVGETEPFPMTIDHLCRNRACVNPNHLQQITNKENVLRGEGRTSKNAKKTHCLKGHLYDEENTIRTKPGHRRCAECHRTWSREYYHIVKRRTQGE